MSTTNDTHTTGAYIYGVAGAAVASIGGFLWGVFTAVVASTAPVASQVVAPSTYPFIFALGGAVVGFFLGYREG